MTSETKKQSVESGSISKLSKWELWGLTLVGLFVFFGIAYYFPREADLNKNVFDALSALFSLVAVVLLFYTAVLQRELLDTQKDELQETRRDIEKQRRVLQQQADTMARQKFETTFFNLLDKCTKAYKEKMVFSNVGQQHIDECLKQPTFVFYNSIYRFTYDDMFLNCYSFYTKNKKSFDIFLSSLILVLDFIDNADVEERLFYARVLRAEFSEDFLTLFMHVLLHDEPRLNKIREALDEYHFFEDMPENRLHFQEPIKAKYKNIRAIQENT